jgi:predicted Ser/Thr protein kinase
VTDALAKTATAGQSALLRAPPVQLGRYRIERELGTGGMGVVYAAFDPDLERRVALKLLRSGPTEEARTRLLREARAMAKLSHPNVVAVYEVGTHEGTDYVAMELVDGDSLATWLREAERGRREVIDALVAAGRGLAAAHAVGLVHRDFKPHNVLRAKTGHIKVTDFGLARPAGAAPGEAPKGPVTEPTLTATGSLLGTPAYMAPEQWRGGDVGPATDQFAFCVALWEALANERPFRGDSSEELRASVERGPRTLDASKLPRRLREIVRRGLELEPAARWPSMDALLAEITRRRRSPYIAGAAAALLAVAAFAIAMPRHDGNRLPDGLAEVSRFSEGASVTPAGMAGIVRELHERKVARFVPSFAAGQLIGLKLFAIKRDTFLDAIGLGNADLLVAIDGQPTLTDDQLDAALAAAGKAPQRLEIGLMRGRQPVTLTIKLK